MCCFCFYCELFYNIVLIKIFENIFLINKNKYLVKSVLNNIMIFRMSGRLQVDDKIGIVSTRYLNKFVQIYR